MLILYYGINKLHGFLAIIEFEKVEVKFDDVKSISESTKFIKWKCVLKYLIN